MNALRWKFFSQIIDARPEETSEYDIYRPLTVLDSSGESTTTYSNIGNGRCFWFYPKEESSVLYQGRQYLVDVILMYKPEVDITFLDLVKLMAKPGKWYRAIDIQDMNSHLEIHCSNYLPDNGIVFDRFRSGVTDIQVWSA